MTTTADPLHAVAEIEVWLHQHGVATVAGGADSAIRAAADLLRALGVDPVDTHRPARYVIRCTDPHPRATAMAGDATEAEDMAHVMRITGHPDVLIEVWTP